MADQATASNVAPLNAQRFSLAPFEAVIEGKVQRVEQPDDSEWTYTTVQLKAKDEYSSPATVQLSQPAKDRPFARPGDIIKAKVMIGGYGRRYNGNLYITNTLNFVELL